MSNYSMDPNGYNLLDRRRTYQQQNHSYQQNPYTTQPLQFDLAPSTAHEGLRYHTTYPGHNGLAAYSSYSMQTSQPLTPISATTPLQYEPARYDNAPSYYPDMLHHPVLPRPTTSVHHTPIGTPLPLFTHQGHATPQSLTPTSQTMPVQPPQSPKIPEVEPCTKNFAANSKDPDLSVWGDPCESAPPLQPGGKRRVYCWYCDKIFDDRKWVQRHAENHFYPAWECNLCHNRAHRPDVLERHCKVTCLKSHNRQNEEPKDHVKKTSPLARERAEQWRKSNGKEPLRASKKARVTGPCDSPVPVFAAGYASASGSGATTPSQVSMNSSRSNSLQGP